MYGTLKVHHAIYRRQRPVAKLLFMESRPTGLEQKSIVKKILGVYSSRPRIGLATASRYARCSPTTLRVGTSVHF
jgi:hypothetical protein